MSATIYLDDDLARHMEGFKRFKAHYFLCIQRSNNLQDMFEESQKELSVVKERENKKSELLLTTQNICNQQLTTIKNLKILTEEYHGMKNELENKNKENDDLYEKIQSLKLENDLQLESQNIDHIRELAKEKEEYFNKIRELQEEISLILASSEIQKSELEKEIKKLRYKYDDELRSLKSHNNRLQSTVIIYEKQIREAEEKCKVLEREKNNLLSFKSSFMTPDIKSYLKNVTDQNLSNNSETDKKENLSSSSDNITVIQNNLSSNNANLNNSNLNISKNNNCSKQNSYENQKKETTLPVLSDISNSDNEQSFSVSSKYINIPVDFPKPRSTRVVKNRRAYHESDFSSDSECETNFPSSSRSFECNRSFKRDAPKLTSNRSQSRLNMMPLPVVTGSKKEKEPQGPVIRKRKLYDPNKFNDLDDFFIP